MENGLIRADGTPHDLMASMSATVIEVSGSDLRTLKQKLTDVDAVISASQSGTRLRVLVDKSRQDPLLFLGSFCHQHQLAIVRPSLEDVFVISTGGRHVG
jgi:ABC-2 type transport system ATP-binding protein